jgi:aryl-alcohol dehydrogenase-like predicted oxidoreductase
MGEDSVCQFLEQGMEYTRIQGVRVSRIGLGTWAIGGADWGAVDERESIDTCLAIFEHGINFIDTAFIYGQGRAERSVGKAIAEYGRREDFVIATKGGLAMRNQACVTDGRPAEILREIDESLKRLQVESIDLYQLHWPDPLVPIAETANAMRQAYEAGKIRALGVSNCSVRQMEEFRTVAPLHASQPPLNIFERDAQRDVLPYCRKHDIAVLAWSALCRSLLTGKIHPDQTFPAHDIRSSDPKFQSPRLSQYVAAVRALDRFAQERYGKRVLHLALRWLLDQPGASVALWGAKRPDQLLPSKEVFGWKLTGEDMQAIDRIVREHVNDPVGPGYLTPATRE